LTVTGSALTADSIACGANAIATAANILAASASALLVVGAIALGLFAAFKLVEKLLGKGGTDPNTYWLKLTHDLTKEIHDWVGEMWGFFLGERWQFEQEMSDWIQRCQEWLSGPIKDLLQGILNGTDRIVDAIMGVPAGATGLDMAVSSPTLFRAGEMNKPERVTITPLGQMQPALAMAGGSPGGQTRTLVAPLVFNIGGMKIGEYILEVTQSGFDQMRLKLNRKNMP
jgi:hypothetical protein